MIKEKELINVANILRNEPKGTPLYCSVYGDVALDCITYEGIRCTAFFSSAAPIGISFDEYGRIITGFNNDECECTLFPSREQKRWESFVPQAHKYQYEPFEKVLVRSNLKDCWKPAFFAFYVPSSQYSYEVVNGGETCRYRFCVPYNDATKHLIGTSEPSDFEEFKAEEEKRKD